MYCMRAVHRSVKDGFVMPSKDPEVWERASSRYRAAHPEKVATYTATYKATH